MWRVRTCSECMPVFSRYPNRLSSSVAGRNKPRTKTLRALGHVCTGFCNRRISRPENTAAYTPTASERSTDATIWRGDCCHAVTSNPRCLPPRPLVSPIWRNTATSTGCVSRTRIATACSYAACICTADIRRCAAAERRIRVYFFDCGDWFYFDVLLL